MDTESPANIPRKYVLPGNSMDRKEVKKFALTVEKKVSVLSKQPGIGSPRNQKQQNIRHTVLYKRVSLIYRINSGKKEIELLRFWNTYQNPSKLKAQ